ncbi:MAG: formimidoylglutamate deiminase [Proteobacteria bacterium]|nr:formimidoylglutamate deiminase [Pseudomonadota bacterium]
MTRLWLESALLPQGWAARVRIEAAGGRIERISDGVEPDAADERHALGIPGMPNLHSHAFQRGIAGLTERRGNAEDSFWSWRELMYRFVERMDAEDIEAISAFAYAEMLEAGFTHVGEFHYVHHDRGGAAFARPGELAARIAAAADASGIGLTLLPTFYAHGGFGGAAPAARQARFITDPERFARIVEEARAAVRTLPGASVGVAAHSLRAVTPAELAAIVRIGEGGVIHIHIAEQVREVEDCIAWSGGQRPVEWLLAHQDVDEYWCLVHATHVTPAELTALASSGAVAGLCPMTEASLGDGIFPAARFLAERGRFGIGSDSNVRLDAAEELRLLEYGQRLDHRARNVLAAAGGASTGRSLFEGALEGGWQVLQGGATGAGGPGLAVGASLDLVTLKAADPSLLARTEDELLDSWIFSGGRAAIDCVWRAGVKLVSDGRHRARAALLARYGAALKRLLA